MLGKQWILYYTRASIWGSIVDRGRERHIKFVGLRKWGFHLIMASLPVMLQFALLLFFIGIIVFLWDLNISAAGVVLAVTGIGGVFYTSLAVAASIWEDCPYQMPLSIFFTMVLARTKGITTLARHRSRRWSTTLQHSIRPSADICTNDYVVSNPALWREDPLFTPLLPEDISASAGFWLLEKSTDLSAATAFAAVFTEFRWPSHHHSKTALVRLRDTYTECFRQGNKLDESTRLKALESASAYYVLYHTQLLWNAAKGDEIVKKLPSELPHDLLDEHRKERDEWNAGADLFEYLLHLHVEDRSESVTSARFLSYIAPYWSCGNSEDLWSRPRRFEQINELIQVLEDSRELDRGTVTDCVLCVGAMVDFPLHPEDLIRADKRCVCSSNLSFGSGIDSG